MYKFEAMNGCSICNAMQGLYAEEPARPHPYCRCVISEVDDEDTALTAAANNAGSPDRTGEGWSFATPDREDAPVHMEIKDGMEVWTFGGVLEVTCCDGSGSSFETSLTITVDPADRELGWVEALEQAFLRAEADIEKEATEWRDENCEPCDHVS
jgi:hypothetical protein